MNNKNKWHYAASLMIMSIAMVSKPAFSLSGIIPDNVTHFKIDQTAFFHVYNNVTQPGMASSFDLNVSKDKHKWHFNWTTTPGKDKSESQHAQGEFKLIELKNGAFKLKGYSDSVTEHNNAKELEHFTRYEKVFYPIPNSDHDYNYIAHLYSKKGELITAGRAHLVYSLAK